MNLNINKSLTFAFLFLIGSTHANFAHAVLYDNPNSCFTFSHWDERSAYVNYHYSNSCSASIKVSLYDSGGKYVYFTMADAYESTHTSIPPEWAKKIKKTCVAYVSSKYQDQTGSGECARQLIN